jgi:hypothetical protein
MLALSASMTVAACRRARVDAPRGHGFAVK